MTTLQLGFLASHGGSGMQAITQAIADRRLDAQARVVISNNSQSQALTFAREKGIPAYHLSEKTTQTAEKLDIAICETLLRHDVQLVILSGYMKKLGHETLSAYKNRIINIHPSLLPKYGGQSMFGTHVHEAVLAARDDKTGVTIHLVDEFYDHGRILDQCEVPVLPGDTVESLRARVLERETSFYVEVLQRLSKERFLEQPS
jgi:phosphoribosylglycinamide formyltransferase-1